jgi:glycosyltransferase involved in cell wall biosynthesis
MKREATLLAHLPPPPPERTGWPWTEETEPAVYAGRTDWPRISIVTPSFNQAQFLEETIRSVLLQNYPNLQYLVIDGGSTDGSVEILKKYAPWIDYWVSERDRGQSHAINKGLERCDGDWFNWINSDDCLLPGALAAVGSAPADAVMVCGGETAGSDMACATSLGRTKTGPSPEDALVNHFMCQQGLFYQTSAVKSSGRVREDFHYIMDLELFARIFLHYGPRAVHEIDQDIAFYRQHADAKTTVAAERFIHEQRRLFHALGRKLDLDKELLDRIGGEPIKDDRLYSVEGLQKQPMAELLAQKWWWNGPVEISWRDRCYASFKRELRMFRRHFPGLRNPRIRRLSWMSRIPEPILRIANFLRRNPRNFPAGSS